MSLEVQAAAYGRSALYRDPWPDPRPLIDPGSSAPYPIDALPELMREAVQEVESFVQAPLPLVAGAALTAVSTAVQAKTNVARDARLVSPCSVYLLQIADSGERKTSSHGELLKGVKEWEAEQRQRAKPRIAEYAAAMGAFEAKRKGLQEAIKAAAKNRKDSGFLEHELADVEKQKPETLRFPRVLLQDETTEALAWSLAKQWPSSALVSSEGGMVFGGHGMKSDAMMQTLALLNILWDGDSLEIGRKTKESFSVRNARLTVSISIQPSALQQFMNSSGGLARGSGFLARFLVAWPDTRIGQRMYVSPPHRLPGVERFKARIIELLGVPPDVGDEGLDLPTLDIAGEAKEVWRAFHDAVERDQASGGELETVRDIASKIADNAARLACLFHVFKGGSGSISADTMNASARLAGWHLSEAKRYLERFSVPPELQEAIALDRWLIDYCSAMKEQRVARSHVSQYGPMVTRKAARLNDALAMLVGLGRVREIKSGNANLIEINPRLLPE